MSKEIEINTFLNDLAKIYSQNPNLPITSDTIYYKLMNYDFSEEEIKNRKINNLFDKWIDRFKNNKNINVFHAEWQNRFLQFLSPNYTNLRCVKLYLSFPKDKMYECVNKVFDYISSNNMSTASKVADIIRSDSVVIRLDSEKNSRKVIDFVNNDLYLSNNCKNSNPFLLKQENVGIAYDYMLSYNSALSLLLEMYFKYCRINNKLNQVSLETFREYANNFHNNVFNNKQALEIFLKNEEVAEYLDRFDGDEVALVQNYEEIIRLICKSLNPNMDLEQYFNFYNDCLTEEKTHQNYNKYADIMGREKDNSYEKAVELLNEYIKYAELKYGGYNVADYLQRYLDGHNRAITRDNDYRNKFMIYLSRDMLNYITKGNIIEYVNANLTKKTKQPTKLEGYNLFLSACIETYKKYGANQVYNAITSGLNGDYGYFTNGTSGYRNMMAQTDFSKDINAYCKMVIQEYGNGIHLSNHLYENATNSIVNMVRLQRNEIEIKVM